MGISFRGEEDGVEGKKQGAAMPFTRSVKCQGKMASEERLHRGGERRAVMGSGSSNTAVGTLIWYFLLQFNCVFPICQASFVIE